MIRIGRGRKNPNNTIVKQGLNPVWLPSLLPTSKNWNANCFPVSPRTENKPDYAYMGSGSKINGPNKNTGKGTGRNR